MYLANSTRRARVLALGALLALSVLAGCGSTHHAATSRSSAGNTTVSTIPVGETVAGMHYVQLRNAVAPVLTSIRTTLDADAPRLPTGSVISAAQSAIRQFEAAAVSFQLSGPVASALVTVRDSSARIASDFAALNSVRTVTGPLRATLRADIAAWFAAERVADSALGVGS